MSHEPDFPSPPAARRRVSGTAKVLLGFVVGALVMVVAFRYVPGLRDATLTAAFGTRGEPFSAKSARGAGSAQFASRLSYELSRAPDDVRQSAATPKVESGARAGAAPAASPPSSAAQAPAAEAPIPAEHVLNARPINPVPPEPRDRTREIQKEAQNPEYRETPRAASGPGKVFEGRDVQIKPRPPEPPSRRAPERAGPTPEPPADARPAATGATGSAGGTESLTVTDKGAAPVASPDLVEGATPGTKSTPADAIESRLRATRDWLGSAAQTTHTIQLLGSPNEAQLKSHLLVLSKVLEPGKLYVFRTVAQGKPSLTVAYGEYSDRRAALQAIEELPSTAAAYRPVLRTVNGIRSELKQHGLE